MEPNEEVGENTPKINRRDFLKLAGATTVGFLLGGIVLKLVEKKPPEKTETEKPVFLPVQSEDLEKLRKSFGFNPEATKSFLKENSLDLAEYGRLAAAGVSFIVTTEDETNPSSSIGSGGLVEYQGKYYLVSTQHVLLPYLENPEINKILVSIPGLKNAYLCQPTEIFTFNPRLSIDHDSALFLELTGDLLTETKTLIEKGELTPFSPMPLLEQDFNKTLSFFRFQGGGVGLHDLKIMYEEDSLEHALHVVDSSRQLVIGPGTSGSLVLIKEDGKISGQFMGLITQIKERIYGTEIGELGPDQYRVLGNNFSCAGMVTTLDPYQYAAGYLIKNEIYFPSQDK